MTKNVLVPGQIFTIADILSPAECNEYISLTENIGYTPASITTSRGFQMRPDIRNNDRGGVQLLRDASTFCAPT